MTDDEVPDRPGREDYPAWSVRLAEVSRPLLLRLRDVPRGILLIVVTLLLLGGLFLPGIEGGLIVAFIGLFLLWLALLAWPMVGVGGRIARVGVALVVLAYAVAKMVGAV